MALTVISVDQADVHTLYQHLSQCDDDFIPALSSRTSIVDYAEKIARQARRFEAWCNGDLIGLIALYCNAPDQQRAFITSVSVLPAWRGKGIASRLMEKCIAQARMAGFQVVELEVDSNNLPAQYFYHNKGFTSSGSSKSNLCMRLNLVKNVNMTSQRNFNVEIRDTADHQYAYNFDFDVIHPYMIRSFEPFFLSGNALELGSFKGDFSQRLLQHFDDLTCVEASEAAITEAQQKLGSKAVFFHSVFESVKLKKRYDNIFMTHVLEHLDDPVRTLERVNCEWLNEKGRLFLACPNANAPSRQIAVKMGLISHNTAVTSSESEHGHRCTYTLDTLERDAVSAGLEVIHRSGVFFKALANFQWDRLLKTDIISMDYLEGCYKLGQVYPDLCSSIFLICERGSSKQASGLSRNHTE